MTPTPRRASCRTALGVEVARTIPGVREATRTGDRLELVVDDHVAIAPELYRRDPAVAELTISRVSLEDALVLLLGKDQ